MTANLDEVEVLFKSEVVELKVGTDYISLTHDDIKTLTTLLERYKSALKEAHGG